jgi:Putative Actinobacterial Holin-X, holin superfamily III
MFNPMPKPRDETVRIPDLLKQLAGDGVRVVEAELQLAKGEAGQLFRQYAISLAIYAVCFALVITALGILAQAGAVALSLYFTNPAYAYLSVGLLLIALTIGLLFLATTIAGRKHKPVGLISKWLAGHGVPK